MTNNFVVITTGYTASGKSTAAKRIAEKTSADLYHSAVVRKDLGYKFTKEQAAEDFFLLTSNLRRGMDIEVYNKLSENCRKSLIKKHNVVLDAGFFFKWQRKLIYKNIIGLNTETFIVRIECPEEEIFKRILDRNKKFSDSELNETPSLKAYESSKKVFQNPEEDFNIYYQYPKIIKYNSHTKKISTNIPTESCNLIKIINALQ